MQVLTSYSEAENAGRTCFLAMYDSMRKTRGQMGVEADGRSYRTLFDETKEPRAIVEQAGNGNPAVELLDSGDQVRAQLFVTQVGDEGREDAVLLLNNADGQSRLQGKTQGVDNSSLAFFDGDGANRFTLLSTPDGAGTLSFFDSEGRARLLLGITPAGAGGLSNKDAGNVERIGLEVLSEGNRPVVRLQDRQSQVQAALGMTERGSGFVATFSEGGQKSFQGPEVILEDVNK